MEHQIFIVEDVGSGFSVSRPKVLILKMLDNTTYKPFYILYIIKVWSYNARCVVVLIAAFDWCHFMKEIENGAHIYVA